MAVHVAVLICISLMLQGALSQPKRPVIPNSFTYKAFYEYLGGTEIISQSVDHDAGKVLGSFEMTACTASFGELMRYDTGNTYLMTRLGPINSCIPSLHVLPPHSKPYGMWDWVKSAIYIGQKSILGMMLDVWATNITVGTYVYTELGVSPKDANTPVVLNIVDHNSMSSVMFHFQSFTAGAPPSTTFSVPLACGGPTQKIKHALHSPPVLPPFVLDPSGEIFKSMPGVGKF